jgi:hypothetical protein
MLEDIAAKYILSNITKATPAEALRNIILLKTNGEKSGAAAGFHDHYIYFVAKSECTVVEKEVKSDAAIFRVDINSFIGKLK